MTRERLIAAITKYAPAQQAIDSVVSAAKRVLELNSESEYNCLKEAEKLKAHKKSSHILLRSQVGNCLLAQAWRKPFTQISVGSYDVSWYQETENKGIQYVKIVNSHGCHDVVNWFDTHRSSKVAAQAVLDLLNTPAE